MFDDIGKAFREAGKDIEKTSARELKKLDRSTAKAKKVLAGDKDATEQATKKLLASMFSN